MSGSFGAQRQQGSPRAEQERQAMWVTTVAEIRGRVARIDRGETSAPPAVVRCLRVFVAPEVRW